MLTNPVPTTGQSDIQAETARYVSFLVRFDCDNLSGTASHTSISR